jgi:hypothetical protein
VRLAIEAHQLLVAAPVAIYRLACALRAAAQRSQCICMAGAAACQPGNRQDKSGAVCLHCTPVEGMPDQTLPLLASRFEQGRDQALGKDQVCIGAAQGVFITGLDFCFPGSLGRLSFEAGGFFPLVIHRSDGCIV